MSLTFAKQNKRARVLSKAACVEALENRMLMSTYYVSNSGSDSAAGALATPWATLQKAVTTAKTGDTVILRSGTYTGGVRIDTPGLTIEGMTGETAKIVAPINNAAVEVAVRIGENANNTSLINLDISGGYYYAIKTESLVDTGAPKEYGPQHLLISNCKLHDSGRDVVKLTPKTDYSIIEKSEIYNSGRRDGSNAEGIDAVQANYAILRDSVIHDTTTNGVYYKGGSVGTLIERNKVYNVAYSGILLGQASDYNWFDVNVNPNYYENIDGIVRDNLVYNTQGAGIGAWAALRPQIYNNTCINVAQTMFSGLLVQAQEQWPDKGPLAGQDVYVPSTDVTMYNNIVEVDSSRPAFSVRTDGLTGKLTLSNNIYYQNGKAAQISDDVHGYYGSLAGWQALGYDQGSLDTNPLVNAAANYQLTSSSPAINKGKTAPVTYDYGMNSRPSGGAYDIGAWEFGGTPTTPPVVTPPPVNPPPVTPPPVTPPVTPPPVTPTPTTTTWKNNAIAAQTGKFNLEFDATPSQANADLVFGVSNGAASAVTGLAAIVRFNTTGTIDARNGAAYAADANMAYKAGTKYHFKLVIDTAAKTYDVYVTPAGATTATKIASGYKFRTEQATVSTLNNMASVNFTGNVTVAALTTSAVTTSTPVTPPGVTPAPSTTTDLAKGKKVTASSVENTGLTAAMAVDGNSTTRWASGYLSTAWIAVDLGTTYNLASVKLNWELAAAKAYQVQVSTDGVTWKTVNTQSAGQAGAVTISGLNAVGRYVRINCTQPTTSWGYSLYSFEVYGK